jgi:hypothetical protein
VDLYVNTVSFVDILLSLEILVVDESLIAVNFLGQVIFGSFAGAGSFVILEILVNFIFLSLQIEVMK